MIAPHRLITLLDQVNEVQIANCLYHNTENQPSLLRDHQCVGENFPPVLAAELQEHTGQVWNLEFSHDGKRLATCGSEGQVVVWDLETFDVLHNLTMHNEELSTRSGHGVINAAWSPDDKWILTSSMDKKVRLWDAEVSSRLGISKMHRLTESDWRPCPHHREIRRAGHWLRMVPRQRHIYDRILGKWE